MNAAGCRPPTKWEIWCRVASPQTPQLGFMHIDPIIMTRNSSDRSQKCCFSTLDSVGIPSLLFFARPSLAETPDRWSSSAEQGASSNGYI